MDTLLVIKYHIRGRVNVLIKIYLTRSSHHHQWIAERLPARPTGLLESVLDKSTGMIR